MADGWGGARPRPPRLSLDYPAAVAAEAKEAFKRRLSLCLSKPPSPALSKAYAESETSSSSPKISASFSRAAGPCTCAHASPETGVSGSPIPVPDSVGQRVAPSHFELAAASFYAGVLDPARREEVVPDGIPLEEVEVVDHRATGLRVCLFMGEKVTLNGLHCPTCGGALPPQVAAAAVLAFRGTSLGCSGHLRADYGILKHDTRRDELAIAEEAHVVVAGLMERLTASQPGVSLVWFATGHSLGGFLAVATAIRSPVIHSCVVFEAPGCPALYRGLAQARGGPEFWAGRVTSYLAVPSPINMQHTQLGRLVRVEPAFVGRVHTLHVIKCITGTLFRWLNWVLLALLVTLAVEAAMGVFVVGSAAMLCRLLARLGCVQAGLLACRLVAGLKFALEAHKLSNMIPAFSRETGLPIAAVEMEIWPESRLVSAPWSWASLVWHALVPSNTGDSIVHLFRQRHLVGAQMASRPGYRESTVVAVCQRAASDTGDALRRLMHGKSSGHGMSLLSTSDRPQTPMALPPV